MRRRERRDDLRRRAGPLLGAHAGAQLATLTRWLERARVGEDGRVLGDGLARDRHREGEGARRRAPTLQELVEETPTAGPRERRPRRVGGDAHCARADGDKSREHLAPALHVVVEGALDHLRGTHAA